ncbi:MAG: hypothetical protein QNK73_07190 [Emcibacteraceae bacterium]|jgi:hypothetical protein|tara:strand:- start:34155 stop:34328 length:174 start_codon:yes stop_codon:yes gene_type:complete
MMNRRNFLTAVGGVSALTAINSMEKAEALEYAMNAELDTNFGKAPLCSTMGREPLKG